MLKTIWKGSRTCRWTLGFLVRGNPKKQMTLVPFIRERRHNMTWAMRGSKIH